MLRNITTMLTVFAFLGLLTVANAICGSNNVHTGSGQFVIDYNCTSVSGVITVTPANESVFVYMSSGDMKEYFCLFYEGPSTIESNLIHRISGKGHLDGAARSVGNVMSYQCNLWTDLDPATFSFQKVLFDNCGGSFNISHLPLTITSPGFPTGYPHCAFCEWTVDLQDCGVIFEIESATLLNPNEFVFIRNNFQVGHRFGDASSAALGPQSYNFSGGGQYRIQFVSDGGVAVTTGFEMRISKQCSQALVCEESTSITLDESILKKLNATVGDTLYIAPSWDVKPDEVNVECRTTVGLPEFNFNLSRCQPIYNQRSGEIILTYIVWNAKELDHNTAVQRYYIFTHNFTCVFKANQNLTAAAIMPQIQEINSAADPVDGAFDIAFDLYDSEYFNSSLAAEETVKVPDFVYAQIGLPQVPETETAFIMQIISCWATQQTAANSGPSYQIIENSCESENAFEAAASIELIRNHQPIYAQFKFQSFVWTNFSDSEQKIYVHCDVNVCNDQVPGTNCSASACTDRKRRDLDGRRNKIVSVGPVLISSSHLVNSGELEINETIEKQQTNLFPFLIISVFIITTCFIVKLVKK